MNTYAKQWQIYYAPFVLQYVEVTVVEVTIVVYVFHYSEIVPNSSVVAHTHKSAFRGLMQENYKFEVTLDITVRGSQNISIKNRMAVTKEEMFKNSVRIVIQ